MRRIVDTFIRCLEIITATLFVAMFLAVALQIAARNLLNVPVSWTEELARFLYAWVAFLGAVIITRDHDHIKIDYISGMVSGRVKVLLAIFADLLAIIYTLAVLRGGLLLVSINGGMPLASMGKILTFAHLYAAVPVGMIFILLFLAADLCKNVCKFIKKLRLPAESGGQGGDGRC
jgi:TRAP-type C4-dicarboxylate transport system permease small subunit